MLSQKYITIKRKIEVENPYYPAEIICNKESFYPLTFIPYSNMLRDFYPDLPDQVIPHLKESRSHRLNILHLHVYGNTIQCVDKFPCADCPDRGDLPDRCPADLKGKFIFLDKKDYFSQEARRMRQFCERGPSNPAQQPRWEDVPFRELPHFYPVINIEDDDDWEDNRVDSHESIEIEEDWVDQNPHPELKRLWKNLNK